MSPLDLNRLHRIIIEQDDASIRWEQLKWLNENTKNHQYIADAANTEDSKEWLLAVYLEPEEAVAFRLKFGL